MKSADVPLSAWFTKQKSTAKVALDVSTLGPEVSSLRLSLNRADLERAFTATLELLALPPAERGPERCLDIMRQWAGCRSPKATSAVGSILLERLALVPAENVFDALADAGLVEAWRKVTGMTVPELTALVLSRVEQTFPLPVFDWALLANPSARDFVPLRHLLDCITNQETAKLASSRLTAFVIKDPKALHLLSLLGLLALEPIRIPPVAAIIQGTPEALIAVLDNLPKLAGPKNEHLPIAAIIEALFVPMLDTTSRKRTRACALLARLGSGLLLVDKRSGGGEGALAAVAALGQQFRSSARDPENVAATWFLTSAAQPAPITGELISAEGALRWAFAYEECQQAGTSLGPLESLGRNLGLRPIAEPGALIPFEPRWHLDQKGGLLPDTSVRVLTGGWQHQGRPIIRAQVEPV